MNILKQTKEVTTMKDKKWFSTQSEAKKYLAQQKKYGYKCKLAKSILGGKKPYYVEVTYGSLNHI